MLKVELHAHTDLDPLDRIPHSTADLIDHAAALGYHVLAITLHDRYFDPAEWQGRARDRGILLLSGIERTIERQHVLLINFPPESASVRSLADVERLKRDTCGLVVAPHAFYPTISALRRSLDAHSGVFDALEVNTTYTRWLNFNRAAERWAREHGKPLVGNTDLHVLEQMGTTYSLVDAPATAEGVCDAIRAGRVVVRTTPLSTLRAATLFTRMCVGGAIGRTRRLWEVRSTK
jgi:predicted metal-dependent phosphoesterase TrpH